MKHLRVVRLISDGKRMIDWCRDSGSEMLYPVGCIFKLCVAMLIGEAIREGRIGSADDPVIGYFGNIAHPHPWKKMTIAHALAKTTGLVWPGPGERLPDSMDEIVRLPFTCEPGTAFQYKPDPQIAVCLLGHIYGKPVDALFEEKIGCRLQAPYQWNADNIEGMCLSVDAMETLADMLLNGGSERLFEERFLQEMMRPRSLGGFPEQLPYGLGCWIGETKGERYLLASGFGGQMLAVSPERRRIAILLSDMDRPHPENRQMIERMLGHVCVSAKGWSTI